MLILTTGLKAFAFSSCQFTNHQIPFLSGWFSPFFSVFPCQAIHSDPWLLPVQYHVFLLTHLEFR